MSRDFPAIEFRHLRYFIAAAEQGSFRQAAASLDVEASAVGRRIRDLEDELGASLFHRHSSGIALTLAGQRFLRRARKALQQINDGARDVSAIGRSEDGKIGVGIFSSFASGFLSDLFQAYDQNHAEVRIDFVEGDPADHLAAVRQFRLDVAFITGTKEWPGCDAEHLWTERVFVVLPSEHALARRTEIDWTELSDESFIVSEAAPGPEIHDYLVQRLADLGHHPEVQLQVLGRDNLLAAVSVGRGLTLVSEAATVLQMPGIVFRPIVGEELPFSAVWSAQNDNPAWRRLLSLARSMARRGRT